MTTEMKIPTKVIQQMDDQMVLGMIPTDVLSMLGEYEESGYDLRKDERHMFFARGFVKYSIGKPDIDVEIE